MYQSARLDKVRVKLLLKLLIVKHLFIWITMIWAVNFQKWFETRRIKVVLTLMPQQVAMVEFLGHLTVLVQIKSTHRSPSTTQRKK